MERRLGMFDLNKVLQLITAIDSLIDSARKIISATDKDPQPPETTEQKEAQPQSSTPNS
jgi:hypothetical protein